MIMHVCCETFVYVYDAAREIVPDISRVDDRTCKEGLNVHTGVERPDKGRTCTW